MTNPTTRRRQTTRKSLRQSLKELLQRYRRQTNVHPGQIGSGILRRAGSSIYLPEPSRVSLFPDFESSTQFDIDSYSIQIPNRFASEAELVREAICSSPIASRVSLLPVRSLSHFNLNRTYAEHSRPYRPTQLSTVPELLVEGCSRQASLLSLRTLRTSNSTLRLRESKRSLRSDDLSQTELSCSSKNMRIQSRSKESLNDLRSLANFQTLIDNTSGPISPTRNPSNLSKTRRLPSGHPSITSIKHFGSFCVLDTLAPGCPVAATSQDLKYVFDVGDHFFLNNQECTDASMDIVTGSDADGNEVTHLVLFSPLVSPSSGRSRFLLAALIDVTFFIKDAATVPEVDTISEESILDEGIATPVYRQSAASRIHNVLPKPVRYELSCEDLLGGCYIEDDNHQTRVYSPISDRGIIPGMGMYADVKRAPTLTLFGDIWTDLAQEEMTRDWQSPLSSVTSTRSGHSTPQTSPSLSASSSTAPNVDNILDSFMSELQQLYSDFFLLAKSPLDAGFYEICNVSPLVYVSKDYVHGHLSHSSRDTITRMSELLGGDTAFDIVVRWGIAGDVKQLYCIPLFGQRDLTWICMLVNVKLGALW